MPLALIISVQATFAPNWRQTSLKGKLEYPAKGASQGRCGAITKKAEETDEVGEFGDAGKFGELTVIFLLASWVEVWAWLGKVIHFMGKDKTLSLYMGDKLSRETSESWASKAEIRVASRVTAKVITANGKNKSLLCYL